MRRCTCNTDIVLQSSRPQNYFKLLKLLSFILKCLWLNPTREDFKDGKNGLFDL